MNTMRIALVFVLALLGTSCRTSSVISRADSDERAEAIRSSERDDREAIMDVLRGVEAAFSELDLTRWLSHFHSSFLLMSPEGAVTPHSESEALAVVRPLIDELRAQGYTRSEMKRATVKVLSPTTALAAVEWSRLDAAGEELQRIGVTYAFLERQNGWKIVMVSVHPPETLLELE